MVRKWILSVWWFQAGYNFHIYDSSNFTFPLSLAGYFVLAGQVIHENIRLQFFSQSSF